MDPKTAATLAATILDETTTTVGRSPDGEHFTGAVDGHRFKFMTASRATAERERDKALRAAAAWQAILDADMTR